MDTLTTTKPQQPTMIKRFTKRQRRFVELWLDPQSDTFGNAYQSALSAGYGKNAARVITGEAKGLQWVQQAKDLYASVLGPEHIYLAVQDIALNTRSDRDKLNALTQMGKWNGMEVNKTEHSVKVTFTNSVPRPIIDMTEAQDE